MLSAISRGLNLEFSLECVAKYKTALMAYLLDFDNINFRVTHKKIKKSFYMIFIMFDSVAL